MKTTLDNLRTEAAGIPDLSPDAFARAVWGAIIEPGDQTAGALVAALGAEAALRFLLEGDSPTFDELDVQTLRERTLPRATPGLVAIAFRTATRFGATLITPEHPHWPKGFADLGTSAPHALWVRGNSELLSANPSTAIVGARAATGYGEHVTMEISAALVERGHTIVSGAAYGIDGMAHRAALASHGSTIAYLAGGVDRYYPSGHDTLLTRIAEEGAVVSELPCGQPPTKWRFLMRNRLIAAHTERTVVVEAGWRSGSLNTAGHAVQIGRPVGAVPGPITSAASAGCHRLIRDYGATLVTNAEEVAEL
ncbi:MAG: dprA [Frondihabitans sp.]|nr:dprA [Frondihabitans sp.]